MVEGAPRRRPRGHPRRRLQPHGRGRRRRTDAVLPRPRTTPPTTAWTSTAATSTTPAAATRSTRTVRTGLRLVMDALRHWREEMHVDGFRFDLAAALGRDDERVRPATRVPRGRRARTRCCRRQAHRRALGRPAATQVGDFPPPAGASGTTATATPCATSGAARTGRSPDFATGSRARRTSTAAGAGRPRRSTSSPSTTASRSPTSSATTHKHNEANGEDNRDGTDDNRSWNCGVEGPTDDPAVLALRARQRRNLLATLLLSQGVPMLLGRRRARPHAARQQQRLLPGQRDELGRLGAADAPLAGFVAHVLRARRSSPELRRRQVPGDGDDVAWYRPDGEPMTDGDWGASYARAVAVASRTAAGPARQRVVGAAGLPRARGGGRVVGGGRHRRRALGVSSPTPSSSPAAPWRSSPSPRIATERRAGRDWGQAAHSEQSHEPRDAQSPAAGAR